MARNLSHNAGFTLIELLITIAVAAVLIAFAVPDFTASIRSNRMVTEINELHASLSFARSEAIRRNNNVTVCRSSNGTNCTGNWQEGRIVFADANANGAVNEGEEILRVYGATLGETTLSFSQTRVIYANNGIARAGSNGTFTLCDPRGAEYAKGLIIGPTGRPRLSTEHDTALVCSS